MKTSSVGVTESDRVGMVLRAGSQLGAGVDVKDDIAFNAYITNAGITVGTGELSSISLQDLFYWQCRKCKAAPQQRNSPISIGERC
jgi:hypothetical protein